MAVTVDARSMLDIALDALAHGFAVVPPREDGSKRPDGEWKQYQQRLPTEEEVRGWYEQERQGIGVVCGAVSGNLEMLEFEGRAIDTDIHDEYAELAGQAGLGDVVDRIFFGYCEFTPTGGLHLLYRVDGPVAGNTKLARRPATPAELDADPNDRIKVLIETRGEGGYVIVAPSHGPVHPTSGEWLLTHGGFASVATITPQERDELHRLARILNQLADPIPTSAPSQNGTSTSGDRPGDVYNQQPDIAAETARLLERHGWTPVFSRSHGDHHDIHFRRPGKNIGTSAVLHMDAGTLVVFSTSTQFTAEEAYTPFAVYTTLEHGGDFQRAARTLKPASGPTDLSDLALSSAGPTSTGSAAAETTTVSWQLPSPTIDEFLDEPEPDHVWLIPGLLERMDRCIITAGEGVGKSTFIRQIGVQASSGIHPFTLEDIPPIKTVLLDLENSRRHVRRALRDLRHRTDTLNPDLFIASVVPEGIDLMHDQGLMALDDLLGRTKPDLVLVGPLYKLASGDPKDEEQAQAVRAALDLYRVRYDCAFLIEAHQPYATGGSTRRPLRPYGASLWSRWPEFGIALVGEPDAHTVELRHWRGARDERDWPTAVSRGAEWPWVIASGKAITFARMLDIGREHLAEHGELPSIRIVAQRLADQGVEGNSSSAVGRAIKANQAAWDSLLMEVT